MLTAAKPMECRPRDDGRFDCVCPCGFHKIGRIARTYHVCEGPRALSLPVRGPGSWLKWLLAKLLRQVASANCSCNAKAAQMDQWGCLACLWKSGVIVGWLGEEARKRKLRFSRIGAGCLILAAISLAAGEWAYRKCRLAGNRK